MTNNIPDLTIERADDVSALSYYGLIRNQNMEMYGEESLTRRMYRPLYRNL